MRGLRWLVAATLVTASACVDDNQPAGPGPGDASFVGYSDAATRQTTCGNCHISKQRQWENTAHATAWADLQASSGAASYCSRCHTTNGSSNQAPDSAGFFAVGASAQPRYYDVQCESCHGPGATHIAAPDDSQPLTTIAADTGLTVGCGTCHTGVHTPFVSEWRSSRHGSVRSSVNNNVACADCHDGRKFIRRVDGDAKFLEQDSTNFQPVVCSACHDPHGSDNPAQLRLPIDEPNLATNLCMACHYRRSVPDPSSSRGPHAPQGPMLVGEAGWRPSTFTYDSTASVSSHGSAANTRLCASCHMHSFTVTDSSGAQIFTTGHTFRAIPCTTPAGAIDTATTCTLAARTFRACMSSGCHASETAARTAFTTVESRFNNYIRQLWLDVDGDEVVDAFPADSGMLAIVKRDSAAQFTVNPTITPAEGALFNVRLMKMPGNDVHNPFYGEALMIASIDALRRAYGLPVPPAFERQMRSRASAVGLRRNP